MDFESEKIYLITMSVVRSLLNKGLISNEEYIKVSEVFIKKYNSILGKALTELI